MMGHCCKEWGLICELEEGSQECPTVRKEREEKQQEAPKPLHPYFAWRYSGGKFPKG